MRIIVTANQVPFMSGGAEHHIRGLVRALQTHGHEVELMRFPFQFNPESSIQHLMDFCAGLDLSRPSGQQVDRVISLQFPGYAVRHPHHIAWVMHQHRAVYELFEPSQASPELRQLSQAIHAFDRQALAGCRHVFANSGRVAERLQQFNGVRAEPLSHPPPHAEHLRCAPAQPYIFYPSRLETLKRQDLLIESARHLRSDVGILIAGTGGQETRFKALVERHGLQQRVRFLGQISEAEKLAFYANCLGVFFGPFDEDYGYITLEAMLSSKPVITCQDSGGPLAFVRHLQTGHVVAPEPMAVAQAVDALALAPDRAADMGRAGRDHYQSLGIHWDRTVERLLSA
jgi:glycosyltransferase involved in cell wall biosynthesis